IDDGVDVGRELAGDRVPVAPAFDRLAGARPGRGELLGDTRGGSDLHEYLYLTSYVGPSKRLSPPCLPARPRLRRRLSPPGPHARSTLSVLPATTKRNWESVLLDTVKRARDLFRRKLGKSCVTDRQPPRKQRC